MHRLFVAIDFPPDVCDRLAALCSGVPGARWVAREQLHLTLRFVGEVEGPLFSELAEALATLALPGFSLALKGVGHFPPRGPPRVLWAGVEPACALLRLRQRVETLVVGLGVEADGRKFLPHVTLARLKNAKLSRIAPYLAGYALFACPPVPIDAFHLYSSRLGSSGPIHRIEASYPLLEGHGDAPEVAAPVADRGA